MGRQAEQGQDRGVGQGCQTGAEHQSPGHQQCQAERHSGGRGGRRRPNQEQALINASAGPAPAKESDPADQRQADQLGARNDAKDGENVQTDARGGRRC